MFNVGYHGRPGVQFSAQVSPSGLPLNVTPPAISGPHTPPRVGDTITSDDGTWTNSPTGFSFQWRRCDSEGGSCVNLEIETASTYAVVEADIGFTLKCVVTASNESGSGSPTSSAATGVATPAYAAPVNTVAPVLDYDGGTFNVATVDTGIWTGYPDPTGSYSYQWKNSASPDGSSPSNCIGGGNNTPEYSVQAGEGGSDAGKYLLCVVTASTAAGITPAISNVSVQVPF